MITGRSLSTIRSAILTDWSARMVAQGLALDTSSGSWAYELADALAVDLLRIEGSAEGFGEEIQPTTATTDTLDRMAGVQGQSREEGVPGQWTVDVTGTDGTVDCAGRTLLKDGLAYRPGGDGTVTVASGTGSLVIVADLAGADYDLDGGDVLTWDSAPTGLDPTATVDSSPPTADVEPTDEEGDETFALRVQGYRRARPASGNSAGLIETAILHQRVAEAYVYPALAPNSGSYAAADLDTPGAFVVLVAGPAQGQGATNTRDIGTGGLAHVQAYFAGTEDADEASTPTGSRRYSSQLAPADVGIERPIFVAQDVDITVENDPAFPLTWTGSMTIDGASTTTSLKVAGDHTAKNGLDVIVQQVSGGKRGEVERVTLPGSSTFGGGVTTWVISPAMAATPAGFCDPAPDNWESIRDALFTFFDTLGPGDVPASTVVTPPAGLLRRRRFPPESWQGVAGIWPADIMGVVMGADGVLDVTVTTPGASPTPDPKNWRYLGQIRVRYP